MKNIVTVALLVLSAITVSCTTYQEFSPHSAPTEQHPGSDQDCKNACAQGRALHCAFAEDTPAGGTCEEVCRNSETSGYASMNPACMAKAKSCEQADDCANQ